MKEFLIWLAGEAICVLIMCMLRPLLPTNLGTILALCLGGVWGYIWSHKYLTKDL